MGLPIPTKPPLPESVPHDVGRQRNLLLACVCVFGPYALYAAYVIIQALR
jgi:hypothetical protein